MVATAKVLALMDGRYAVSFQDIRAVAAPALRHRIIRSFEAEADQVDADRLVEILLERVPADYDHPDEGPPDRNSVSPQSKGVET